MAPQTEWILAVFLGFFLVKLAVETLLDGLNLTLLNAPPALPPLMAGHYDPDTLAKSRAYTREKQVFGLVMRFWDAVVTLVILLGGVLPWVEGWLSGRGLSGLHLGVAFMGGVFALSAVLDAPFSLYATFVIEARHGFNRQTLLGYLADRLKGLALAAVLGVPLLYGLLWVMTATGPWWWVWAFLGLALYQLVMVWAFPAFIAPWFNRFTPLEPGPLKDGVEALCQKADFGLRGVFIMDASKRSGHSNAYFTGFGRAKRIVLFDTLIKTATPDQVLAVLAHEIGHAKLGHIRSGMALNLALMLAGLGALAWMAPLPAVYQAFGLASPSPHGALLLGVWCGGALLFWLGPLMALFSRRHEYQADAFSARMTGTPQALAQALLQLSRDNLSNPTPHPAYSAYHYSHPTLSERLAALDVK